MVKKRVVSKRKNYNVLKIFNKLMLIIVLTLGIIVVGVIAYGRISNFNSGSDEVFLAPYGGDWRCRLSPDFCSCTAKRWCVNTYTWALRDWSCNVKQGYCSNGQVCSNGRCIPNPNCTNECSSSGARQCSGNGYKTCGNYDADACLEWSSVTQCRYPNNMCSNGLCYYDNFESGILNLTKWEIRQDTEGQPFMDEYGVLNEGNSFVFHTRQNSTPDKRVYLFPKKQFTTGDSIEYDVNLVSREGMYAQMVLLTGDQYIRIGMRGPAAGFDELGVAHMKLTFQQNNLAIERKTPSGNILIDNLALANSNGSYELYIGSFSNGAVHMDYDNFKITN